MEKVGSSRHGGLCGIEASAEEVTVDVVGIAGELVRSVNNWWWWGGGEVVCGRRHPFFTTHIKRNIKQIK